MPWDPYGTNVWFIIECALGGLALVSAIVALIRSGPGRNRPVPGAYRRPAVWSPRRYWRRPVTSPIRSSAQYAPARVTGATRHDAGRISHHATHI